MAVWPTMRRAICVGEREARLGGARRGARGPGRRERARTRGYGSDEVDALFDRMVGAGERGETAVKRPVRPAPSQRSAKVSVSREPRRRFWSVWRVEASLARAPDLAAGGIHDDELVRLPGGEAQLEGAVVEVGDVEGELHAIADGDAGGGGDAAVVGGWCDGGVPLLRVVVVRCARSARERESECGEGEEEGTTGGTRHEDRRSAAQ